jgi:hypothetical protein
LPVFVVAETLRLSLEVPEPGAGTEAGAKLVVTPVGTPLAVREIGELKPPETLVVRVTWTLCPRIKR